MNRALVPPGAGASDPAVADGRTSIVVAYAQAGRILAGEIDPADSLALVTTLYGSGGDTEPALAFAPKVNSGWVFFVEAGVLRYSELGPFATNPSGAPIGQGSSPPGATHPVATSSFAVGAFTVAWVADGHVFVAGSDR